MLDAADPKKIAQAIFDAAFMNNGQVCLALKRLYVHESIYDAMCEELAAIANRAVVDDGTKQGATLGPLQKRASTSTSPPTSRSAAPGSLALAWNLPKKA